MIAWALLPAAAVIDAALGDPPYSGHPVRLVGQLIQALETRLYRRRRGARRRGLWLLGGTLVVSLSALLGLFWVLHQGLVAVLGTSASTWGAWLLSLFLLYSAVAFQDLFHHVRPIVEALRIDDLATARRSVQRIVGRDAQQLDAAGVIRASIESIAESLSDGLVGPVFYFALGVGCSAVWGASPLMQMPLGIVAAWTFRIVNTLDSMVGYRNERYLLFGRASARADDVLGWLPSRLTVVCLALASGVLQYRTLQGLRVWWRDRHLHASPNAGQSEAFAAGCLEIRLGGPTIYAHGTHDKPWMGAEGRIAGLDDLHRAVRLVRLTGWMIWTAASLTIAWTSVT